MVPGTRAIGRKFNRHIADALGENFIQDAAVSDAEGKNSSLPRGLQVGEDGAERL